TEASVWCCVQDVTDHQGSARPPIGRPIHGVRLHILDDHMAPVPPGTEGELYVGGPGVGRCYAGHPAMTAAAFVPDPFADTPGARLYRTGDSVRQAADGIIDFLGRSDAMVKIRGHRIELGEVEAALAAHPAVGACAVIADGAVHAYRGLRAFVASRAGAASSSDELLAHLRERLPEPMVPSSIRILPALPVMPNGKVDRAALAALPSADADPIVATRSAATAGERTLAAIWTDVLRVGPIGSAANFFELGGDSIQAIQIAARAQAAGLSVSARAILDHPVLADLAAVAGTARALLPAEPGVVVGAAPVTPIQRWFLEGDPVDPGHFLQAVVLTIGRR